MNYPLLLQSMRRLREVIAQTSSPTDPLPFFDALKAQLLALEVPFWALGINIVDRQRRVLLEKHVFLRQPEHGDTWKLVSELTPGEIQGTIVDHWAAGRTIHRPDLRHHDPFGEWPWAQHQNVRSVVDVPFTHGTLAVNSTEPNAFSPDTIALLEEMAAVLSEGFRRFDDIQLLERRAREAEALAAAIEALAGLTEVEKVFRVVVREAAKLVSADYATLLIYDEREGALVPRATVGQDWEAFRHIRLLPGEDLSGRVFASGQPRIESRSAAQLTSPELRPENREWLQRAVALEPRTGGGVPLRQQGRVIGTLSTASTTHRYTPHDLVLLERLGDQAVAAITRAQHQEQLLEREQQLQSAWALERRENLRRQVLQQVREQVWSMRKPQDLDQVVQAVVAGLRTVGVPFQESSISQVKHYGVDPVAFYRAGGVLPETNQPEILSAGAQVILKIWQAGKVAYRPDLEIDDPFEERERLARSFGSPRRSVVDVPFSHGTLAVNSSEPNAFSPDAIALLEEMAAVLSEGFRRFDDLQLLERRAREAEALTAAAAAVFRTEDLPSRLQAIVRQVKQLTGADRSMLLLFDEGSQVLVPKAWEGYESGVGRMRIAPGEGMAGKVFDTQQPYLNHQLPDPDIRPLEARNQALLQESLPGKPAGSSCGIPLFIGDRVGGVLIAGEMSRRLDQQDLLVVQQLASQASLAIERVQHLQEVRLNLSLQKVRNQILQMSSAADWESLLGLVQQELAAHIAFQRCGIQLFQGKDQISPASLASTPEDRRPMPASIHLAQEEQRPVYRHNRAEIEAAGEGGEFNQGEQSVVDVPFAGGTLAVNSLQENAFSSGDLHTLGRFAEVLDEAVWRLRDVEKLQEAEAQLRQSQKLEAVGQLTAGIAHNFNNMLQAILANAELAQRRAPAELYPYLEVILTCGVRSAAMIQQLLQFSRRQASRGFHPVDLNQVAEEVVGLCRKTFDPGLGLVLQTEAGLPQINGDQVQLSQVLLNLLVNARDALESAPTPAPNIRVGLGVRDLGPAQLPREVRPGQYLSLVVEDNGPGMDPATQDRIFEPFFTTKEVGKGTGLGLSTAFGIVSDHGGWIDCESAPGQGTVFTCFFPVANPAFSPTHAPSATVLPAGKGERLLMIDDDPAVRQALSTALRDLGYQVVEASDGQEGLSSVKAHHPDLVVMDWSMPGLPGAETMALITAARPAVKIVVCSGHPLTEQETGPCAALLQKPVTFGVLAQTMRQVLDP